MKTSAELLKKIDAASAKLGIKPSTVGERAGQGGQFYARLTRGCRIWPETFDRVVERVDQMLKEHAAQVPSERAKSAATDSDADRGAAA